MNLRFQQNRNYTLMMHKSPKKENSSQDHKKNRLKIKQLVGGQSHQLQSTSHPTNTADGNFHNLDEFYHQDVYNSA